VNESDDEGEVFERERTDQIKLDVIIDEQI